MSTASDRSGYNLGGVFPERHTLRGCCHDSMVVRMVFVVIVGMGMSQRVVSVLMGVLSALIDRILMGVIVMPILVRVLMGMRGARMSMGMGMILVMVRML